MSNGTATARRNRSKVARAMDIRTVIGVLLGLYGIILTITGLVRGLTLTPTWCLECACSSQGQYSSCG